MYKMIATTLFGDNLAYTNGYFGKDKVVDGLKEILRDMDLGNVIIDNHLDRYEVIEAAIDELEAIRSIEDNDVNLNTIEEFALNLDEEDQNKLIKTLREKYVSYNGREKTVDDLADQIIEWHTWTVKELKAEADYQSLKVSGTKKEIIGRLKDEYLKDYKIEL